MSKPTKRKPKKRGMSKAEFDRSIAFWGGGGLNALVRAHGKGRQGNAT